MTPMNIETDDDGCIRKNRAFTQWPGRQRGKVNPTIIILTSIIMLGIAGGGAYWFFSSEDSSTPSEVANATSSGPAQYLSFKDMVVNLVNDETYELHYMQLSVSIMTRNSKCLAQIESNRPVLLNAMLEQLSSWTFQEVMTPEKRDVFRKQLLNAIHRTEKLSFIKGVEDVFITNMVIQ